MANAATYVLRSGVPSLRFAQPAKLP